MPELTVPHGPVFEDFNLLRAAALAGEGVALCPLSIIAGDLAAGHLVQLSDRTVRDEYAYYLEWKRPPIGSDPAETVSAFREWLLGTRPRPVTEHRGAVRSPRSRQS